MLMFDFDSYNSFEAVVSCRANSGRLILIN